jgi:hypothetical protein
MCLRHSSKACAKIILYFNCQKISFFLVGFLG